VLRTLVTGLLMNFFTESVLPYLQMLFE